MAGTFSYYPEASDQDFDIKIYGKKEFNDTRIGPEIYDILRIPDPADRDKQTQKYLQERCGSNFFRLQNYQQFVRNYISPATPYKGLLLFHGVGSGKTCSAVQIAEGFKDDVINQNQKIQIIASGSLQLNFQKNLYDFSKEDPNVVPGQNQCIGNTYYIPPVPGETQEQLEKRQAKFKKLQAQYYNYATTHKFWKDFENKFGLKPDINEDFIKKIRREYDDTIYIIDEAQEMIESKESKKRLKEETGVEEAEIEVGEGAEYTETEVDAETGVEGKAETGAEGEAEAEGKAKAETDAEAEASEAEPEKAETSAEVTAKNKEAAMKLYGVFLNYILKYTLNVRIILLTATPMQNWPADLAKLINLLRMNDYRKNSDLMRLYKQPIDIHNQFQNISPGSESKLEDDPQKPERVYNIEYFKNLALGYISYVRGENPLTFARKAFADNYLSRPAYDNKQNSIDMNLNYLKEDRLRKPYYEAYPDHVPSTITMNPGSLMAPIKLNLLACPMSPFQYYYYLLRETYDSKPIELKKLALFVFPNRESKIEPGQGLSEARLVANATDFKPSDAFEIGSKIWSYRAPWNTPGNYILSQANLGIFSSKYSRFLNLFLDPLQNQGIHFMHTRLIDASVLIAAAILEQNGFKPYGGKFLLNDRPRDDQIRCYCGCLKADHDRCLKENKLKPHKFKQGVYLLYTTGHGAGISGLTEFNDRRNNQGQIIKIILATDVASVGIDYKRIRHMHLMDPWHNLTQIDQTIGRAIRQCAHYDLPVDQQKVIVYHYTAVPMEFSEWQKIFGSSSRGTDLSEGQSPSSEVSKNPEPNKNSQSEYWKTKYLELIKKFNQNKNSKDIKSVHQLPMRETEDEREYRRSYIKDRYVKFVERAVKEIAVDCNFNYYYNLYPDDTDYENTKDTRELEYSDEVFKCRVPPGLTGLKGPLVEAVRGLTGPDAGRLYPIKLKPSDLDLDTFRSHRYFIEPIINEIRSNIMDLYQTNFVFDLATIEKVVFDPKYYKYDVKLTAKMRREYLHLALNQLIGDAGTRPMEILDRYRRRGYLIFRHPYYVFQPNHIRDSRLPIYYRQQQSIEHPQPGIELARALETESQRKTDEFNPNLFQFEVDEWQARFKDSEPGVNDILQLQSMWNRYPAAKQSDLIAKALPLYLERPTMSYLKILIKHLQDQLLLVKSDKSPERWYYEFDDRLMMWDAPSKQWRPLSESDRRTLFSPDSKIINQHPYYKKILGGLTKKIETTAIEAQRTGFTLPNIYSYIRDGKFIIVDTNKQHIKTRRDSVVVSQKSLARGENCTTRTEENLHQIINELNKKYETESFKKPTNWEAYKSMMDVSHLIKNQLCAPIERMFQILEQYDNTWFFYFNQYNYPHKLDKEERTNAEIVFDRLTKNNPFIKGYLAENTHD